jgi:predicted NBD/HSP70 family sugar kinase
MAGNNKALKEYNQAVILDFIRRRKAVSKADLAPASGLSANAVGMITAQLLDEGYIRVSGTGTSRGGRKPELLSLKPNSYYAMGVNIDTDRIRFALIDHTGRTVYQSRVRVDCAGDPSAAFARINAEIQKNLTYRLLGVGIAVAGQVDAEEKVVVSAPNLQWNRVNVAERITENLSVYLENESIASAIYEGWSGICQGVRDFICVNSKSGIGAGIFADGKVYRGASGSAGEIGHIPANADGPPCACGNRGCLETYASASGIAKLLGVASVEDAAAAARGGEAAAAGVFRQAARYLGGVIAGLINTLNPEKIVLGGQFVKYADLLLDDVKDMVRKNALAAPASRAELLVSAEGVLSSVLGAAVLPLIDGCFSCRL